jgi:hypothetical protein
MSRYSADCREMPSANSCDVKISGSPEYLVEAAAVHMITHHLRLLRLLRLTGRLAA